MASRNTKQRIVEAADKLFYQHGFEHTSFTDIADVVEISRGNFYHHFKTKDEILTAVIEHRLANTHKILEQWKHEGKTAKERIKCFINILIMNQSKVKLFGCPVGGLCTELTKLEHSSLTHANQVFTAFRAWLREQFIELGCEDDADRLAMHLLGRSQGIASIASAFHDEQFIQQEVEQMHDWLDTYAQQCAAN